MRRVLRCVLVWALIHGSAFAQELDFHAPASATDPAVPAVMRDLAERVLPVYQDGNPERFMANLSILQMVAGHYETAYATRQSLLERRQNADANRPGRATVYDLYIQARATEKEARIPFAQAFALAFRRFVPKLEDREAYVLIGWLSSSMGELREGLQRALDQRRGKTRIRLSDALDLIWAYFAFDAYRNLSPLIPALDAEETHRRYVSENVLIKTRDGIRIAAIVLRPKLLKKLPALLEFSIGEAQNDAKEAASHGYVGVMAYARGSHGSGGHIEPFVHDGDDARAVIVWIAKQAWSDGTVAMYGGRYSGYAAFAAAKQAPAALKAIGTFDPLAPGIDFPMTQAIFRNSAYRWAFEIMNAGGPGPKVFQDDAQWRAFNVAWYVAGKSYRQLASLPGPYTVLFNRWLNHPSNDSYWRAMVPNAKEFAHLSIPVLTASGYYSAGEPGAVYYFSAHHRADSHANHTLLLGSYDERSLADLRELRYDWFDHVLKGKARPAILKDKVNYQIMGTGEWRSAPTLAEMGASHLKLFLEPDPAGDRNRLLTVRGVKAVFLPQTFDLADRDDANEPWSNAIVGKKLTIRNGEMFVSEPLPGALTVSGALSGQLELSVNKLDLDVSIALYELTAGGDYIALCDPSYDFRASYAKDLAHRHLLKTGTRQALAFQSDQPASRRLQAGSRIVMVLGIVKRPDRQINYGTGKDVSDESVADARVPLRVRWYNGSYIDLPLHP